MVATPSSYLVAAAVALVTLQLRDAEATSLYYDPVTTANTTDCISASFPAFGREVADEDVAITVEVDPTLPDITTIATVAVTYPELLANTTAPTEAVSTKVGTVLVSEDTPSDSESQDAYAEVASASSSSTSTTPTATSGTKTGVSTTTTAPTATSNASAQDDESEDDANCATGWETDATSRKLKSKKLSKRKLAEKLRRKRELESNSNTDIAKLEAFFGQSMEMTLSALPTSGVFTPSPWPGPYWPTYQDSINVVWSSGEPSAAEKYATAFGLDVTDFMDAVSADNGIDSMSSHTVCSSDDDCSSLTDGSECSIRADATSGYCIPTWYGICHAWTPASMLEDEPECAVTYNGVTFQPLDIKALLSDVYDGASVSTVFTGTRYNGGTDSTDEYGRHTSDSYRDLNPAYFHIAAANLLGNLGATFIVDTTAGSEVWNQPVRGFKVYEQTNMSLSDAAETFYGLDEYPFNAAAESIVYVKTRLSWIIETYTDGPLVSTGKVDSYTTGDYYYYLLEMDGEGEIIGGEWVYGSDDDHPDFLWFPTAKPDADTVTTIGLSYADVTMLLEKSVACSGSSSGSEDVGSSSEESSEEADADSSASFSDDVGSEDVGSDTSEETEAPTESPTVGSEEGSWSTSASPSTEGDASYSDASADRSDSTTDAPVAETTAPATTTAAPPTSTAPATTTTAPATTTTAPATTTKTPSSGNKGSSGQQQQQQQHQHQGWFSW
ncbi:hypothetical protein BBJ28_00019869 [Nothophytophthora sp. Chile5]|nr:hypothetical protein BBJ28_00019869 [Nothophytophthora sp. Chile5]